MFTILIAIQQVWVPKMAVSFTRFSWWLWGGKDKEPVPSGSTINSSFDLGFGHREPETLQFPSFKGTKRIASSPRKVKKKWQSREERRIDKEYDIVLVPSDGGCLSGSESDDSDVSIGWLEPHGPGFQSDDESDNGFAVLVPCYSPSCKEVVGGSNNELLSVIKNLPDEFSTGKRYSYTLYDVLVLTLPAFYTPYMMYDVPVLLDFVC